MFGSFAGAQDFSFSAYVFLLYGRRSGEGEEPCGAKVLRLIPILFSGRRFTEDRSNLSSQASPNFYVVLRLTRLVGLFALTTKS
jgi:hypothetical protein